MQFITFLLLIACHFAAVGILKIKCNCTVWKKPKTKWRDISFAWLAPKIQRCLTASKMQRCQTAPKIQRCQTAPKIQRCQTAPKIQTAIHKLKTDGLASEVMIIKILILLKFLKMKSFMKMKSFFL